ncbi:MAG: tRNA pseudouridine(13) synthase TruD [Leptospiraceae bacterium]|nr:tRNA pseudouridine(13) synthase TruD [Leptospiraceae bacterium]
MESGPVGGQMVADLPLLTSDLAGIGGRLKESPADFVVTELPLYEPCGTGEHLYLRLRSQSIGTLALVALLARLWKVPRRAIGTAGIKDKMAISEQTISIHLPRESRHESERALVELGQSVEIRQVSRHTNKLRTGHLRGNLFAICLRDVRPGAIALAEAKLGRLGVTGWPNFYGPQRFGLQGDNHEQGIALLTKRSRIKNSLDRLLVSAAQSWFFNACLAERIRQDSFQTLLSGDVLQKTSGGGLFYYAETGDEQKRFEQQDISHTGLLPGRKVLPARAAALDLEQRIQDQLGWSAALFDHPDVPGSRRLNRIPVADLELRASDNNLRVRFGLLPGSYATTVLREIQNP